MIIRISRTQDTIQGGDDTITLSELLAESGYCGKFDVDIIDDNHPLLESPKNERGENVALHKVVLENILHSFTIDNR